MVYGAGDGNRTHATSLEGWDSTVELHPHITPNNPRFFGGPAEHLKKLLLRLSVNGAEDGIRTRDFDLGKVALYH